MQQQFRSSLRIPFRSAWYRPLMCLIQRSNQLRNQVQCSPKTWLRPHPISHRFFVAGRRRSLFCETTSPALVCTGRAIPLAIIAVLDVVALILFTLTTSVLQPCHALGVVFFQLGKAGGILFFPFSALRASLLYPSGMLDFAQCRYWYPRGLADRR